MTTHPILTALPGGAEPDRVPARHPGVPARSTSKGLLFALFSLGPLTGVSSLAVGSRFIVRTKRRSTRPCSAAETSSCF